MSLSLLHIAHTWEPHNKQWKTRLSKIILRWTQNSPTLGETPVCGLKVMRREGACHRILVALFWGCWRREWRGSQVGYILKNQHILNETEYLPWILWERKAAIFVISVTVKAQIIGMLTGNTGAEKDVQREVGQCRVIHFYSSLCQSKFIKWEKRDHLELKSTC